MISLQKTGYTIRRAVLTLVLINSTILADPVHFWPFYGEAEGASSVNATLISDRFNNLDYAYQFDGMFSYIEYADTPSLDLVGEMSIETWVFLDSTMSNENHTLLVKTESTSNIEIPNTYSLGTSGDSTYRFCVGGQEILFGDATFGEWTHVAVTFRHEIQRAKCYINGELILDHPALLYDIQASDYPLLVGANAEHNLNWHGVIDDIRLFNRAITESEIDSLYNLTFGPHIQMLPEYVLEFGNHYVGYPDTLELVISNIGLGLDSLVVSELAYSGTVFQVDQSPFTLPSGSTKVLPIIFNPAIQGYFSDLFYISTNDPLNSNITFTFSGSAVFPPEISVYPGSIQDTLYTGGVGEHTITIDNSQGLGDLHWSLELLNDLDADTIYFEKEPWTDWALPESQDSISENVILTREVDHRGLFNAALETECDEMYSPLGTLWGMGRSLDIEYEEYRYLIHHTNQFPAIVLDTIMSLQIPELNKHYDLAFESWLPPEQGSGYSYYRIEAPSYRCSVSETSGIIGVGSVSNIILSIDAFRSLSDTYNSSIVITSNDLEEPIVHLPIVIETVEAPDVQIESELIDLTDSAIGYPDSVSITVHNSGYGSLLVLDVETPQGPFGIEPSQMNIPSQGSATFTLTFNPTSESDYSGDLVFVTNDPDEASFRIPIIASSNYPPVMVIDNEVVEETVTQGDTLQVAIQIQNDGNSTLLYNVFPFTSVYDTMISNMNTMSLPTSTTGKYQRLLSTDANDGDSVSVDLESLSFTISEDTIEFCISTFDAIDEYWSIGLLVDVDRNLDTGWFSSTHWSIGSDYYLIVQPGSTQLYAWDGVFFTPVQQINNAIWEYGGKEINIQIDPNLLPHSEGWDFGVKARIYSDDAYDYLPDQLDSPLTIPMWQDEIDVSNSSGMVPQGGHGTLGVNIAPSPSDSTSFTGRLVVASNDPNTPEVAIPIHLDVTTSINEKPVTPDKFKLYQNYPNPFNPNTKIRYDLPRQSEVSLAIYDILGREVWSYKGYEKPAGSYSFQWDGLDLTGKQAAGGMYFARLQAGEYSSVVKMVYLR